MSPAGQRQRFLAGSVIAGVLSVIFLLWIVLRIDGPRVTDGVDDIGELVAAWCATVMCIVAASRSPMRRAGWVLLAASTFAWGVGELLWTYYDMVEHIAVPFPSWADAGFLTAAPLMFAGLLVFPCYPRRAAQRAQGLIDGCIIALALLFASWETILGPLYRAHQGTVLKQVLSLAYPMSDVVMASLVIILIARARGMRRTTLGLVMVGVVAFAVADSSFAYLTEVNNYGIGNFLDTGWVAGFFMIGLGALHDVTMPDPDEAHGEVSTISIMAPYVPVLLVLAVTTVQILRGVHIERVGWVMVFALALLVVGREIMRLWDQARNGRLLSDELDPTHESALSRDRDADAALLRR